MPEQALGFELNLKQMALAFDGSLGGVGLEVAVADVTVAGRPPFSTKRSIHLLTCRLSNQPFGLNMPSHLS